MYEEDECKAKWTCPACKTEGIRINYYMGRCTEKDCIGVAPERSIKDIRAKEEKKDGGNSNGQEGKQEGPKQTYWTDGSGKKIKGAEGLQNTGWATIRFKLLKDETQETKIKLAVDRVWRGGSGDLESVARCEARAILKAVQETPEGGTAHVHTDSLGTVQELKTLTTEGNYAKSRKAQNKHLVGEILALAESKQLCVIIEWVKGHETMSEDTHNWISRMKMEGNELVDKEAKRAGEEPREDEDFPMESSITFRHEGSGIRVGTKGLIQWVKEYFTIRRRKRLADPADPTKSMHGQGKYLWVANLNRSLVTKQLWKGKQGMWKNREWIRKYMIEAVPTRQFKEQHPEAKKKHVNGWCPICALAEGKKVEQTKEHLYGGQCVLTNKIRKEGEEKVKQMLTRELGSEQEAQEVQKIWEKEEEKLTFTARCIEQHKLSPVLVGVWSNITVLGVRNWMMKKKEWTEETAYKVTFKIIKMKMEQGKKIHTAISQHKQALSETPHMTEVDKTMKLKTKMAKAEKQEWREHMQKLISEEESRNRGRRIPKQKEEERKEAEKQRWEVMTGKKNKKRCQTKGVAKKQTGKSNNREKRKRENEDDNQAGTTGAREHIRSTLKRRQAQMQSTEAKQGEKIQEEIRRPRSTIKRRKVEEKQRKAQTQERPRSTRKRRLQEQAAEQPPTESRDSETQQAEDTKKQKRQIVSLHPLGPQGNVSCSPSLSGIREGEQDTLLEEPQAPSPQGNGASPPSLSGTREGGQATLLEGLGDWPNSGPPPPMAPSGTGAMGGGGQGKDQRGRGEAREKKRARSPGTPLDHVPKRAALQSQTRHRVPGGKQGRPTQTKLN